MNGIKTPALLTDDETPEINSAAFTVTQVATLLQLSRQSVYRLVKKGLLPRLPGLRCIRVPREGFYEYLAKKQKVAVQISASGESFSRPESPKKGNKSREADPNRHGLFGGTRGPQAGTQGRKKDKDPFRYGF